MPPPPPPPAPVAGAGLPAATPPPPGAAPPPARPSGGRRRGPLVALVGVAAVVLVLGVAAGVLAATGAFSGTTTDTVTTKGNTVGGLGPPGSTGTVASPSAPKVTGANVRSVLDRYAAAYTAYTAHDAAALRALFAPTFTRTNANQRAKGLDASLAEYKAQFRQFPSSVYHLSVVDIKPGAGDASAAGVYTIDNAGASPSQGSIGFHLSQVGSDLKIDAIALK
ncbi:MAG TPA: DUF4440 domain-containing protein [Solirubrobacteraceae bacterium]|nr:DUF4440 domain-containing protein [Solirubrobacteraceae bacterium]